MKFENIRVYNFANALHGMRNPKNSWYLSDSSYGMCLYNFIPDIVSKMWIAYHGEDVPMTDEDYATIEKNILLHHDEDIWEFAAIGPKDMKLAQTLIKSGPEHRKFLRQIFVTVDITAPIYWWKEFDTYKIGTTANSTSTMHKLTSKPITIDCFETDDYDETLDMIDDCQLGIRADCFVNDLEQLRQKYLMLKDENPVKAKKYWKELVRWLPESWLQTRTVTMNYENLLAICSKSQRRFHKLTEWSGDGEDFVTPSFIKFARSLPYAKQFIFIDEE
jgi:hypothetical protein